MTSYSFSFSLPWWLAIILGIIAAAISVYSYRFTVPPLPGWRRYPLIVLRTLGLWILLFALVEPILLMISATKEPARVAVLLDNSQSAGLKDASRDRRADFYAALNKLNPQDINGIEDSAKVLLFDNTPRFVPHFTSDSLQFNGQFTNITAALSALQPTAERSNTRAILLMTDGVFNAGENPVYAAEDLARPVYVIGIGDTTEPKDISVSSLLTNDLGYIGAPLPVTASVQATGLNAGEVLVTLLDNNEKVAEERLRFATHTSSVPQTITTTFSYTPTQGGIRKLTVQLTTLSGLEGELTKKNNSRSEFVKILKNKRKVVMVAGQPTPDISFIRTALTESRSVECTAFIESAQGGFLPDNGRTLTQAHLVQELQDAEAVILVGFPIVSTPPAVVESVRQAIANNKPLLFVAGRELDYSKLKPLEPYLPFVVSSPSRQELMVLPDVKQQALAHPVMKLTGGDNDHKLWNSLPPLYRTETFVRVKPESEVLATMRINNVALQEPLLVQRTLNTGKSLAVLGYGLYRWKLLGFAAETARGNRSIPDIFGHLLDNSLRWLTVNDQGKFVRIKSTRQVYANGEKVELTGQVYDKTYNPVDNADVRVNIQGGNLPAPREISLLPLGGGRYMASVEGLSEGDYNFAGRALLNNQSYGEDSGRFSVGELHIEYQSLRMNVALLRQMTSRTGGKFFTAQEVMDNPQQVLNAIRAVPSFTERPITEKREIPVWNLPGLLAAAIVLFSLEWVLRKLYGLV